MKIQLIGKDPDDRKDQRQKEKGAAENAMGRQYHQLNQHEFEQTSGESEEELKRLLMKVKESEKVGLKLNTYIIIYI